MTIHVDNVGAPADNDFVEGPASSINNAAALFDGTTGKKLKVGPVLGTMAQQASNSVAITGGSINNTTVGTGTPSTGHFSLLRATNREQGTPDTWIAIRNDGTFTRPASITGGMPVNIGGTGATNAANARINLGLGSAALRDADAMTQKPNFIVVSTMTTRPLLAAESGSFVLVTHASGIAQLPPASGNTGVWYEICHVHINTVLSCAGGVFKSASTAFPHNFSNVFNTIAYSCIRVISDGTNWIIVGGIGEYDAI